MTSELSSFVFLGIAFQVATKPLPKPPKKPTTCPGVLEMRHIVKYKPLDNEVRQMMCDGVKAYRDFVTKQMAIKEGLLPVDPRDKVEKEKASQLLQKVSMFLYIGVRISNR